MTSFETIRNPIFRLYWAGWEADTLRLQREGWEISMMQDVHDARMQVAIKHPQFQIYGLSRPLNFEFMRYASPLTDLRGDFPIVSIERMASQLYVTMLADLSTFQPVSAIPEIVTMPEKKHIDDFKIFRPLDKVKEIIIAKSSVSQMLEEIIKQQDPKQAEIRERRRKELHKFARNLEGKRFDEIEIIRPESELVAQIIAVA